MSSARGIGVLWETKFSTNRCWRLVGQILDQLFRFLDHLCNFSITPTYVSPDTLNRTIPKCLDNNKSTNHKHVFPDQSNFYSNVTYSLDWHRPDPYLPENYTRRASNPTLAQPLLITTPRPTSATTLLAFINSSTLLTSVRTLPNA